jgi:hypothetical protein
MFLYFFANFELSIRRISSEVVGFSLLHHDDGQPSIRDIHMVYISIFSPNLKLKIRSRWKIIDITDSSNKWLLVSLTGSLYLLIIEKEVAVN